MHPCFGVQKHVRYRCFEDWESAATFLRTEKGCDLCGIVAQNRNAPTSSAPPPSEGSVAAASPRAAVTENAHPEGGEVTDNTGAAGSRSSGREHGKVSAVEQRTNDAAAEGAEDQSPSSSTPSPPAEQPLESSQEGQEHESKDSTAAASTAVRRRPFRRSTAFLVGHRNRLEEEALRVCDFLVHIEQVLLFGAAVWCTSRIVNLEQHSMRTREEKTNPEVLWRLQCLFVCILKSFLL